MGADIMTIDPSCNSVGWAVWSRNQWPACVPPLWVGLIKTTRGDDVADRVCYVASHIKSELVHRNVDYIIIECPVFFASTAGGQCAASSGDLIKLSLSVGAILGAANGLCKKSLIRVNDWKGQLPKRVINDRILAALGPTVCAQFKEDIWDAVGIGLFVKGYINRDISKRFWR